MPWVFVDDNFADHPKIVAAGPLCAILQIRALCYANRHLTDGFIPEAAIPGLLGGFEHIGLTDGGVPKMFVHGQDALEVDWPREMIAHGLWEAHHGGFRIHDYLDYQKSRQRIETERAAKQRAGKIGGMKSLQVRHKASDQAHAQAPADGVLAQPHPLPSKVLGSSKGSSTRVVEADADFLATLRDNPAYQGIDLEREFGRMRGWLSTPRGKGRKLTRQFIVNWLNKVDRPLEGGKEDGWHPGRHET